MSDSTKHWADREERGSYWLMKLTAFAAKVLGRRLLSPVLYGIVLYFFLFGRTARQSAWQYQQRLADWSGRDELRPTHRRVFGQFMAFADSLLDKLDVWNGKLRLEQIEDTKLQGQMRQDLNDMIGMLDATLSYLHEQRTSETRHLLDVQALVESMSENAQDQGSDVQFSGTCAPLQVQPMALRSCLNNLIDNALRYAGTAQVGLEDSREALVIRVIDHGPGIAADKREAVFEPFYRLEGSRNRNSGGVGLGMTISKEAVERIGGRLSLEETPGGGLTAVMWLPRA